MNVLVVGGAGFIGSHLVDRLLADGESVDVIDDLSSGSLANLAEARGVGGSLKIHHLDAGTVEAASLLGMRRPDVLFHLAAVPRRDQPERVREALRTTMALFDAAQASGVPKIVVALPATVLYGRPAARDLPLKERELEPRGVRGVIARATADLLAIGREQQAVEYTAVALSSVYGSRQRGGSGVVASFAEAAATGKPPTIAGDGRQTRDFLFVDDAVDALVRAGTRGSGLVVNVGTGEQTSVRDLWSMIAGPTSPAAIEGPPDAEELQRFAVSPVRARIHLSWSPWTELDDGLSQLS